MKKTKNRTTEIFFFMQTVLDVHWLNWNDIKRTGLWNFNHRNFKILSKNWHWNHSKTVRQLIVINFAKSLPDYRIFFLAELHTVRISFIIYFVYWILMYFFFSLFFNTSNYLISEFSSKHRNFDKPNSQHVFMKNRGTYTGMKKQN